jgi:tetratricopeptide (TPR) repeat protein
MRLATAVALLCLLAASPASSRADGADAAVRTRLLSDLSAEAASVRDRAIERLSVRDDLTPGEIAAALRDAAPRARPLLYRLAAARRATGLVPEIAAGAAGADAPAAEAALRALVTLGEDAVEAGRAALAAAAPEVLPAHERDARLRHLRALDIQRLVERELISRWRRKGGSYRGRYDVLASHGWDAQPVLLAMLLDIPLEDQFVVPPEAKDPELLHAYRLRALDELAGSRRRGYRTFEPLPPHIEADSVFELAVQALCDVADLTLLKRVLLDTHEELVKADKAAGFRVRPWEEAYARDIEVILWRRGEKARLQWRHDQLAMSLRQERHWVQRMDPDDNARVFSVHAQSLDDLASVLHQMDRFDEAAARYAEVIEIRSKLTGMVSSVAAYNRACALARGGREDEALEMLRAALDPVTASGSDDLTREWVLEDGDLESLRDDPRFLAIVRERFGK